MALTVFIHKPQLIIRIYSEGSSNKNIIKKIKLRIFRMNFPVRVILIDLLFLIIRIFMHSTRTAVLAQYNVKIQKFAASQLSTYTYIHKYIFTQETYTTGNILCNAFLKVTYFKSSISRLSLTKFCKQLSKQCLCRRNTLQF